MKTLKELIDEWYLNLNQGANLEDTIKRGAIEWIKDFNERAENDFRNREGKSYLDDEVIDFVDSGYDEYGDHPFENVINWIRKFFNITGDDLK